LVAWICNRDHVLASKLWELLTEAGQKTREFILDL
jgi:hypothetical protein